MQHSWSWKRSISPCALGRQSLDCLRRDTNMSYQRKQISNAMHTVSEFVPGSKKPLFFTRVKPQKPLYCSGTSSKWAVLSGKHHSHELISDSTTRSSETNKHTYSDIRLVSPDTSQVFSCYTEAQHLLKWVEISADDLAMSKSKNTGAAHFHNN